MRHDNWGVRSLRWAGIGSTTVTVAGARVHVLRAHAAGDAAPGAPTQVLLHGLGGGGAFLLDLMRPLTAYGPVVAPDLPGSIFGETETPRPKAARIDSNARFVRALVAALGIDTAVVHAWSMGAAVAIRFAASCPDQVERLVLACPPLPAPLTPVERAGWQTLGRLSLAVAPILVRGALRLSGRRLIETKLAYLETGEVPSSLAALRGDPSRIPPDTMAVWTDQLAAVRDHPATLGYAATAFASVVSSIFVDQAATWAAIDRIVAPVLVLWGDEDPLVERPMLDHVLARRPDWDLHVFEGAGHGAPVERPDEYVDAIARWLASAGNAFDAPGDARRPRPPRGEAMTLRNAPPLSAGRERLLLWFGTIGPALFVVAFLVTGTLVDGYDPLRHPVSSLVLSAIGWVQVANFLVTGALLLAFVRAFGPLWRRHGGEWAPRLIGLVGIGLIGSRVFPTDPISGYPPGTPMVPNGTVLGALHGAFGAPVFLGLPAACGVVAHRFAKAGRTGWAIYSGAVAVVFVTGLVLLNLGFSQHPVFMPIGGLIQRVTLIVGLTWLATFALHLLRHPPSDPERE